jgi:caffeoyl-CoA O-methyltransferase
MIAEFNHLLEPIRQYVASFPTLETELQKRMRSQATAEGKEHWIIPPEVGQFLALLTRVTGARRVYEIGSYLGYSATWFAQALPEGGRVVLTETDPGRYEQAVTFFDGSPLLAKLDLRHCDAHHDLVADPTVYDIILIDHDKPRYAEAYPIAKAHVKTGGLIIADNVLWRRRIVDPAWGDDPSTRGILDFNRVVLSDPEVDALIVPIGDGVCLCSPR